MGSKWEKIGAEWLALLVAFWLLAGPPAHGQGQYSFRSWQSEDGLPVNLVRSIVQATDGHLWIATSECIVRFDGIDFERVELTDSFPYPSSGDSRLFATADGTIWFSSSQGGLVRMVDGVANVIWQDNTPAQSLPVSQVIDSADGVIVRRGEEVWRIRGRDVTRLKVPENAVLEALKADLTRRANKGRIGPDGSLGKLVDRSASVWAVSPAGELTVTSPEGVRRPITMPRGSSDSHVTELLEDLEGNIWVATALNGLVLFREDRVEVVNAAAKLSEGAVLAVIEDTSGKVWLGNRRGGVDRIINGKIEHHELPGETGTGQVSALYEDRDGRLWAASKDGPVFRWRDSQFVGQ